MDFDPWMLDAIDEAGYNGVREDDLEEIADLIKHHHEFNVSESTIRFYAAKCGINPNNLTRKDISKIYDLL